MSPERRRLIPTVVAVLLGVAFLTATLVMSATMKASITAQAAASVEGADAVVVADASTTISPDAVRSIARQPGVTGVDPTILTTLRATRSGGQSMVEGHITPSLGSGTTLVSGRLPRTAGEAAVSPLMVDAGVGTGSALTVLGTDAGARPQQLRVVGVISPGPQVSMNTDSPQVFTDARTLMAARGAIGYDTVRVTGTGGQEAVASAVRRAQGVDAGGITVRTADARRSELTRQLLGGSQVLTGFMGAFAVIAVAVTAIVIVNTFAILVAQRTRSLGLARCVGATRAQIRTSVLVEALVIGAIGSVLGLAVGVGLAQLLVTIGRSSMNIAVARTVALDPVGLLVPAAAGVLMTVLAALPPARRATRVPPVAALSPAPAEPTGRAGRVRLLVGAVLVVLGVALLVRAATGADGTAVALACGVAGGLASFGGVLVLAIVVIPRLALALGRIAARMGGVPAELATENTQRSPGRAAATVSALLVGVTLIVMTAVGTATAGASANRALDQRFPADAIVQSDAGPVTDRLLGAVRNADGVAAAGTVLSGRATLVSGAGSRQVSVSGYSAGSLAAIRDSAMLSGLDDRHALVRAPGVRTGQTVTVRSGHHRLRLIAVATSTPQDGPAIALTDATMRQLLPGAADGKILVRYADGTASSDATAAVTRAISSFPGTSVSSAAQNREQIRSALTLMLGLVVGLLAISVVIALVGVGNTLGLSVLERTREIGLLRALGLTRRQTRAMFGHEAVLESLAAVTVGLVLGVGYGIAGTYALLGSVGVDVVVSLPWLQLAAVAAIAMAAGWSASVVPGRHAARVSPAMALAGE